MADSPWITSQIFFSLNFDPIPILEKKKRAVGITSDNDVSKPHKKQRIEETVLPLVNFEDKEDTELQEIPIVPPCKKGISEFSENDVLSGRGGGTNVHSGNRNFRDMINLHRRRYLKAKKNDKPAISRAIVRAVRESGGRFLKKDEKSGLWFEIGDTQAREKTSQALRQRAPEMRRLMYESERHQARNAAAEQRIQQILMSQTAMNNNNLINATMGGMHTGQDTNDDFMNTLSGTRAVRSRPPN